MYRAFCHVVRYIPLKGNSYIPLPEELQNSRKGLINIKNYDDECFRWCHICHINPVNTNLQRITTKEKELVKKKIDYSGISFPGTIKQIEKNWKAKCY